MNNRKIFLYKLLYKINILNPVKKSNLSKLLETFLIEQNFDHKLVAFHQLLHLSWRNRRTYIHLETAKTSSLFKNSIFGKLIKTPLLLFVESAKTPSLFQNLIFRKTDTKPPLLFVNGKC